MQLIKYCTKASILLHVEVTNIAGEIRNYARKKSPWEAPDVFKGTYTSDTLMIYTKLVNNLTFVHDTSTPEFDLRLGTRRLAVSYKISVTRCTY